MLNCPHVSEESKICSRLVRAACAVLVLTAAPAFALHKETPPAIRITSDRPARITEQRTWTRFVPFVSDADLLHNGSVGQQIFVWDHFAYLCNTLPPNQQPTGGDDTGGICPTVQRPYLLQVTNGPGNPDNPSLARTTDDASGQIIVAFDADGIYGGLTGSAGATRQIFVKNLSTGVTRTITNRGNNQDDSPGNSIRPTISLRGGFLTFESTAPIGGFLGVAGISQILGYDLVLNVVYPITGGHAPSTRATMNRSGTVVVFESRADLLGNGQDTGVKQLYWANVDQTHFQFQVYQLTNGNGDSTRAYVSESGGSNVLFESLATDIPNTQPSNGPQIFGAFLADTSFPTIEQFTFQNVHGDCTWPSYNQAGSKITALCNGDPLHNGSTGRHVFVLNLAGIPALTQIDYYGDVQGPVTSSIGNFFVAMSTTEDMTGTGNCDHQIHVIDYFGGHWFGATQQMQVPQTGTGGGNPAIACSDGDPCTTDTCQSGTCIHDPIAVCTTTTTSTTTTTNATTTTIGSTTTTSNPGSTSSTASTSTTTTHTTSTSTTTTTQPDPCGARDAADLVLCRFQQAAPFCDGAVLPKPLSTALNKCGKALQRVVAAPDLAAERRSTKAAVAVLKRAAKLVQKYAKSRTQQLSIDCGGSLYQLVTSSRDGLLSSVF